MGVDGEIKIDVHSTLPMHAMLDMARSIAPEDVKLPLTLEIKGDPELKVYGTVGMGKGWKGPFRVDRLQIEAAVTDVSLPGVEFASAAARGELIGRSINVTQLDLAREDGHVKLEGSYLGTDLVFTLESDLKPELLVALAGEFGAHSREFEVAGKSLPVGARQAGYSGRQACGAHAGPGAHQCGKPGLEQGAREDGECGGGVPPQPAFCTELPDRDGEGRF